ncbi:hypothetical protein C8R43DRAFT_955403 [Mycena crocata]|nr:hypothetical protein C8R43DRAFT_955403 [Mycena crocata]
MPPPPVYPTAFHSATAAQSSIQHQLVNTSALEHHWANFTFGGGKCQATCFNKSSHHRAKLLVTILPALHSGLPSAPGKPPIHPGVQWVPHHNGIYLQEHLEWAKEMMLVVRRDSQTQQALASCIAWVKSRTHYGGTSTLGANIMLIGIRLKIITVPEISYG